MTNTKPARRRCAGVLLAAALLVGAAFVPATASAAAPAFRCSANGATRVSWRTEPQAASVEVRWFDANGNVIGTAIVQTTGHKTSYRQPTPPGATEVTVLFFDASGTQFGQGGGVCV